MANRKQNNGTGMDPNAVQQLASAKAGDLNSIANSDDGQKVKAIMEKDADKLKQAMETGDVATLKNTLNTLMGTEEGARLIGQIQHLIK